MATPAPDPNAVVHCYKRGVVGVVTLLMAVEAEQVFLRSAIGVIPGGQSLPGGRIIQALPEIDRGPPAVHSPRIHRANLLDDVVRRMTRRTGYSLESLLRNRAAIDDGSSGVEARACGSLKRRMTLRAKRVLGRGMIGLGVPRVEPSAARQLPRVRASA